MTETVYLASGDEIASIKNKLDQAKGNPIILIAPKTVKALRNPLTLKLVKRHTEFLGKELVLVASDRLVRYLALYHGLPAYASLTQVRRWKPKGEATNPTKSALVPPHKLRSRLGMRRLAIGFFAFIVVTSPFVAGYLLVPSATVTLFAASQTLSETVGITASVDAKSVDYETGTIPGRIVETQIELTDQTDIEGKKFVPDTSATGQVTFINKTDAKVTVPKGTLLSAKSGFKFRTADEAIVPSSKGASARVTIIADQPGKAGNVEKLAIDQVLDLQIAAQVSVANENPTQGGTDKEVGAVTDQDRTRLEAQAIAKGRNDVFQKILNTKTASESIYPQTLFIQIVDEQFDRKVGEETKTLSVKLLVKGSALAFEARDVNSVVAKAVAKKVPEGLKIGADGIKVRPLGAEKWSDRTVSFYAQGDAKAATVLLDEDQLKREIAGMSKQEAEQYIARTLVLADRPEVKIEPRWTDIVPRFSWRIKINFRVP